MLDTIQTCDSVLSVNAMLDTLSTHFVTSGFEGVINPLPRVTHEALMGWNLVVLAVALLAVVVNKQLFSRQFRQLLSVPSGVAQTNQLLREWSPLRSFIGFSSLITYVALMGLFVQKSLVVLSHDMERYNGIVVFAMACGGAAVLLLLRYLVLRLVAWLFQTKEAFHRLVAVQLSVVSFSILAIQPVLWLLLYNPYSMVVWTGLGIVAIGVLMRFFMGFFEIKVAAKIHSFYIFYYLCSLEIVPMAVLLAAGIRYATTGSVM